MSWSSDPATRCLPAHFGGVVALIMALSVPGAPAQEWTRFRGPAGQGVGDAASLPVEFTAANVRWRVSAGVGHSSPVLWGDRLFLTRQGAEDDVREVVCFDATSGEEVWSRPCKFDPHNQHKLNSHAASTPAVDASGLYVVWSSGDGLVALALDLDGEQRWRRRLGEFQAQHGSGSSPVLHGDLLIVANENISDDSFLTGLDTATGEARWRIERRTVPKQAGYACPVLFTPAAGKPFLMFGGTAHGLTAVEPERGEVMWEVDLGFNARCVGTPSLSGDRLLVSTGSGGGGKECAVVQLPRQAGDEPEVIYRPRRSLPYVPSVLAIDERFYMFSDGGIASCLDAATGDRVWRERMPGRFFSSPVSNGENIYLADRDGVLFTLAKGDVFRVEGTFDLGEPVFATPAIAGGRLFVRTFGHLVCLGAAPAEPKKGA